MIADPNALDGRSIRHRRMAIAAIAAVTMFRIVYLFFLCPYDLAPDEAHYWDWSRHLDWSYYSKGPLVAWIIRAGCEVFGPLAMATDGTLMPAVRLPAVFCGTALLVGLYVLTFQTFCNDRMALWVVLGALSLPAFTVCSLVMTIDAPFLCCWVWALVFGRWAMVDGKPWAWAAAGVFVALGILAKYTMALWLFSAGLFILFTPTHRRLLADWRLWLMGLVAGLSAIPILYWNSQHDWVTFRHVAVQAGVAESAKSEGIRWKGPAQFVGEQFGLMLGSWFVVWVLALIRFRPWGSTPTGHRYLWWMSVPTIVVFGGSTLLKSGQINWPVAAYLSGAVLAAGWLKHALSCRPANRFGRIMHFVLRLCLALTIAAGIVFTIVIHDTRIVSPTVARFLPAESEANPMPARRADLAARLKGWQHLGTEFDRIRTTVRQVDGADPVLAALHWDVPGELGFYTEDHPQAYSLGLLLRLDRHSQYDLWHPNPADDAQAFRGKTFLVVWGGDPSPALVPIFELVAPPQEVVYRENGKALAIWHVCVCRGFRGIDPNRQPGAEAEH